MKLTSYTHTPKPEDRLLFVHVLRPAPDDACCQDYVPLKEADLDDVIEALAVNGLQVVDITETVQVGITEMVQQPVADGLKRYLDLQQRAEEAEQRAEEAERRAEKAEQRAEEAERRAEKAEQLLKLLRG